MTDVDVTKRLQLLLSHPQTGHHRKLPPVRIA